MPPSVVIMPVTGSRRLTQKAIESVLQQTVDDLRLLLVDQGSAPDVRDLLERYQERHPERVRVWHHRPPLPALSATWNKGLGYAWAIGAQEALVVNNDVELPRRYYQILRDRVQQHELLFLSGVGVAPEQFDNECAYAQVDAPFELHPDFAAFLISKPCHVHFQFDEHFVPAYCEDLDYHRRLLLADQGRRIGKINVPFLHHSSQTLALFSVEERHEFNRRVDAGSRAYYRKKWGLENQETKLVPFGPDVGDVSMERLRTLVAEGRSIADLGLV